MKKISYRYQMITIKYLCSYEHAFKIIKYITHP